MDNLPERSHKADRLHPDYLPQNDHLHLPPEILRMSRAKGIQFLQIAAVGGGIVVLSLLIVLLLIIF